jgi:nucleotide-binding universal stress UspA family protein
MKVRRVLHPSDFSRASAAAFARALELAKASRAELVLAHVMSLPVPMAGDGYIPPKVWEEMETSSRAYAQKQIDALVAKARKAGVRVKTLLLTGVPHERIVQAARSQRADLVVMGTHGRTGLRRFFLGSVAERVVASAGCPVMTVRGK